MSMRMPGWVAQPLSWCGLTWPEADEELLFTAGQRWISYGGELMQVAARADQAAAHVWTNNSGLSADAFTSWWNDPQGPKVHFFEDSVAAEIVGAALTMFAIVTLAMKVAFIVHRSSFIVHRSSFSSRS